MQSRGILLRLIQGLLNQEIQDTHRETRQWRRAPCVRLWRQSQKHISVLNVTVAHVRLPVQAVPMTIMAHWGKFLGSVFGNLSQRAALHYLVDAWQWGAFRWVVENDGFLLLSGRWRWLQGGTGWPTGWWQWCGLELHLRGFGCRQQSRRGQSKIGLQGEREVLKPGENPQHPQHENNQAGNGL